MTITDTVAEKAEVLAKNVEDALGVGTSTRTLLHIDAFFETPLRGLVVLC